MELFQVFWDDQRNLNLEFKTNTAEEEEILPEDVQRLNLKYEISKCDTPGFTEDIPSLVSIKKFNILQNSIVFSLDLDQLQDTDDLQIDFLQLRVHLNSGKFVNYTIDKKYEMSEIGFDSGICEENLIDETNSPSKSLTQEQGYIKTERDYNQKTETKTIIYQKNHAQLLTNNKNMAQLLVENNQRLAQLEQGISQLNQTLQNLGSLNLTTPAALHALPPGPPPVLRKPGQSNSEPIVRIRKPPPPRLNKPSAPRMLFMGELKSIIQSNTTGEKEFNFRDILKPMSKDELETITLDEEELAKRELEFFSKQIVEKESQET